MKKKNVVLEQIRKYKWGYLFGIILVAMDAIVTYIYPQLITNILDKAACIYYSSIGIELSVLQNVKWLYC